MIELAVYENGVSVGVIELSDSETFPLALTKSNSDIRDIKKRQGVYSKDFEILATAKNNRILKYIYNANVTAIGGRDCTVLNNGLPILDGLVFAVEAKQREQSETYKLRIFSDNVDWYIALGQSTLQDFDYGNSEVASFGMSNGQLSGVLPASSTQSTLSRAYIEASWRFPALFDYVYALISYGAPDNGTFVAETDMRPSLYVSKLLTKIFASVGYTLSSDFFTTGIGANLILPYIGDNFTNSIVAANSFNASRSTQQTLYNGVLPILPNLVIPTVFQRVILNNIISDPSSLYNNITGVLTLLEDGNYTFEVDGSLTAVGTEKFVGYFLQFHIRDLSGNIFTTINMTPTPTPFNNTITRNLADTTTPVFLAAGTYEFCFEFSWLTQTGTGSVKLDVNAGFSIEQSLEETIVANQRYTVSSTLADVKVLDLIGGLQNMFNLYFETDNQNRTVRIEPKPSIIKPITQGIDFTDKLDIQNRITTDYIQDYNKSLQFSYGVDTNDKWQEQFNLENGTVYGSQFYDLGNNFKDDITKVGTNIYSATLLYDRHPFSPSGCPIPVLWNQNAPSPAKYYSFNPRILYYKGYVEINQETGAKASWRWLNVTLTTIPSSFMVDPDTLAPVDVNLLYTDLVGRNGLAKTYYNSDIAIIADRRIHKAYFNIKPTIFRSIDLFTPVYIDHPNLKGWYYINQIIDYTPNKEKTTLVELVRALDALPFTTPQAIEIPYVQENRRSNTSLGGGTLTAGKAESNESAVLMNGSGNAGIIRGGGVVMGNGNIQTETNQHLFGNYNFENDSVWVVGAGISPDLRYNGLQLKPNGVFNVHGGNVRTIRGGRILDVYATIDNRLENVLISGNG